MVWARTKLTILDNVFEPQKDIFVNYAGKHPERLYNKIRAMLINILNVPEGKIQELYYTWEKHGDTDKFKVRWRAIKDYDIYSYLRFDVILNGSSKNGEGHASMSLKPRFVTEYPQDTVIQQSIFYEMARRAWHDWFYNRKRERWFQEARNLAVEFEVKLKQFLEELNHG